PMMCSRLLRSHAEDAQKKSLSRYVVGAIDSVVEKITSAYALMLRWALRLRWLVLILGLAVGAASAWLFTESKKELTPLEDRGTVVIIFSAPEGSSIDYTTRYGRLIGEIAEKIPEFDRRFVVSGSPTVTQGIGFLRMVDWQDRKRGTAEILEELQPKLLSIPGVLAFAVAPPSLGQSPRVRPINFVVLTSEPYDKLQATVAPFVAELQRHPGLQGVDIDLKLNKPEIKLEIDRQRAADAGVQVEAIGRALETMLGGRQVTRFKRDGEQYDVMVQLDASDRVSPRNIADIYVRGRGDTMVPLASLVSVRESVAPRELNHFAQRRAVTITANLAPGYSLGEAITMMESSAQKYLKPGYAVDYNGETREFKLSSTALYLTFLLALAFIYLVLAAQFESFVDPLIIMFSVPLSMTGALALLKYGGGSINVYSQIGLITLVGLITKHGILIVEF
ncbi:MAG: efflux RND transporter permease subunit, partial [Betaproteobacteria bacterium]|nr:efflux RND transporter permease subunit [Betaproteobacteria bacterium]